MVALAAPLDAAVVAAAGVVGAVVVVVEVVVVGAEVVDAVVVALVVVVPFSSSSARPNASRKASKRSSSLPLSSPSFDEKRDAMLLRQHPPLLWAWWQIKLFVLIFKIIKKYIFIKKKKWTSRGVTKKK